jgi:hypothetical protein
LKIASAKKEYEDLMLRSAKLLESAQIFTNPLKPSASQRPAIEAENYASIGRSTSPSFTPCYNRTHQTESISKKEIFMLASLLLALFLFYVVHNGVQNNLTGLTFRP